MAYASVEELAAALRIRVTAENTAALQRALDAAAEEIDHHVARDADNPIPTDDPLAASVNVSRGVEWFKAQDAVFGVVGFSDTGALQAPRDTFARHGRELVPLKQHFGVA